MRGLSSFLVAGVLALSLGATAFAQTLDAATRKAVVERAAVNLRTVYVFPDVGEKTAAKIEAQLAAGAYDTLNTPWGFAAKVTADMREIAHDKHLAVDAPGGPPPPADADRGPPPANQAGVVRADRLPGGAAYIEIVGFPGLSAFKPAIDKAMASVADAPALIVDVRRNGGGSPESVAYLVSHFVDPAKPMLINDFHYRKPGTTEFTITQSFSQPTPKSFRGKPVYVLTSARTFSGGEEFSYDMQAFKLGTLIGETTGGGANPGGGGRFVEPFFMFTPNGRPVNPVTKTNWEGVGVIPEVAVKPAEALRVALQKLGQSPTSGDVAVLSQARLFEPRSARDPRTEAALRTMVGDLARGEPKYEMMAPGLQQATREQLPVLQQRLVALGPLEKAVFMRVTPGGTDLYELKFASGVLSWEVGLDDAGKVSGSLFRALPRMTPTDEERMTAFRANDADGDGKLDKLAYLKLLTTLGFASQIDTLFAQRDVDRDGFVSAEEYRTVIPQ